MLVGVKAGDGLREKRNLDEDDFRALNTVFNGIILKLPEKSNPRKKCVAFYSKVHN